MIKDNNNSNEFNWKRGTSVLVMNIVGIIIGSIMGASASTAWAIMKYQEKFENEIVIRKLIQEKVETVSVLANSNERMISITNNNIQNLNNSINRMERNIEKIEDSLRDEIRGTNSSLKSQLDKILSKFEQ